MNHDSFFSNQEGFTIQELLVTLIVGSLLVDFCFSLFLFSDKLFVSWQRRTELKDRVNYTLQTMGSDVQGSKQIMSISDSSMTLQKIDGRVVSYSCNGKSIWRNEVVLCNGSIVTAVALTQGQKTVDPKAPTQALLLKIISKNGITPYEAATEAEIPYSAKDEFKRNENGTQ